MGRHRGKILRFAAYLWAFPNTLLGLCFAPFSIGHIHIVDGIVEISGGLAAWSLEHLVPLQGGASAITLGHVVLGRDAFLLEATRSHERIHVRQYERWGPFFIPAYVVASVYIRLRGGNAYMDNPFEREAYARG